MRGADCTVPSREMARVERWRKLLFNMNMMVTAVFLLEVFVLGVSGSSDEVR